MTRTNNREPSNIPNILDSLKADFNAGNLTLSEVRREFIQHGWNQCQTLQNAAAMIGVPFTETTNPEEPSR